MTLREKLHLTVLLSVPAIIGQLSTIVMQIIDASMLGHLSTVEAAAVGLVSTTIWLFGGLATAFAQGFAVQVAHRIGAGDAPMARAIVRQAWTAGIVFAALLTTIGLAIAPHLPAWLGASADIHHDATTYFRIFALGLPIVVTNGIAAASLRCSGNVKTPSILLVAMCGLDIVFNYLFLYPMHMGTAGAALSTIVAYAVTCTAMVYCLVVRDRTLRFSLDTVRPGWLPTRISLRKAAFIATPVGLERACISSAQITISSIIAPLGPVAIAANSFGINVESLCYMPGHGVAEAATTLVGQSRGARREPLMRSFAKITTLLGMVIMSVMGLLMYVLAPEAMALITPDADVIALGTRILRIEAPAEPFFAAAIVASAVFVGAGRTLVPSLMNLTSIWAVRVSLTLLLAPRYGLQGVWIAMAAELTVRGCLFLLRLRTRRWSKINKATCN